MLLIGTIKLLIRVNNITKVIPRSCCAIAVRNQDCVKENLVKRTPLIASVNRKVFSKRAIALTSETKKVRIQVGGS